MATCESVWFNGVEYRRYPNCSEEASRKYYVAIGTMRRHLQRLHQEVYKAAYGPIPPGHQVHHKDHDPLNNRPDNLEALPKADHLRYHGDTMRGRKPDEWRLAQLAEIRPQAKGWHRSPEGHAWHRAHAMRSIHANGYERGRTCEWCGKDYITRCASADLPRFCSPACQSAWRRASGRDNVERHCVRCGNPFTVNKNRKTRLCSMRCVALMREAAKRAHIAASQSEY